MNELTRVCWTCGNELPIIEFKNTHKNKGYLRHCRKCRYKAQANWKRRHPNNQRDWCHRTGFCRPVYEAKETPQYFGVCIAETLVLKYFSEVKRMPYANPGYDFICKSGYKIDVKSSCLLSCNAWHFGTKRNKIADYFILLAFYNRTDINLMHFWIVPGSFGADKQAIVVRNSTRSLKRLLSYEKPLDKIEMVCSIIKKEGVDMNEVYVKSEV